MSHLSTKLILAVSCTAVAILTLLFYFLIQSQERVLTAAVEQNAGQLSETIKSSTRNDMLLNERDRVHQIIDTIGRQEGLENIKIMNKEGRIIYSTHREQMSTMVDKKAEACTGCHTAGKPLERLSIPERTRIFTDVQGVRRLGIINPIYNEETCWQSACHAHNASQKVLGVLDVTMSLAMVDQQMSESRRELVGLVLVATLMISLILGFFVRRLVGRPVQQLVVATRHVAAGNLDYQIKNLGQDELGQLSFSFNNMTRQLAETQRQVLQSDKLASLGRLAAGVAHEINNPLTGILTYSSFLAKRHGIEDETKKDLEVIIRETKRCRDIVKDLLDFSRQAPVQLTMLKINDVVQKSLQVLDNEFKIHRVQLSTALNSQGTLQADANQLEQVLINLLSNAVDALEKEPKTIHIETQDRMEGAAQQTLLTVTDNGKGISSEHLSQIFDPFFTTKGQKGNGLGLAVVWGIVEKHGGTISVKSQVGQGTTFTLVLPSGPKPTTTSKEKHDYAV